MPVLPGGLHVVGVSPELVFDGGFAVEVAVPDAPTGLAKECSLIQGAERNQGAVLTTKVWGCHCRG